jgi:hypothetical protein
LQSEGKQQLSEGVALSDPTLRGDYRTGGLEHEEVAVSAIGPYHHGKQGWAALLDGSQHLVPAQGVEGVLPVHLHSDAGRGCGHAGAEGVPDDLAAPTNADGDLQSGQGAAGCGTSGQGAEGGEPVPDFADCDGPDAARYLGEGVEAGVEKVGKVGKVATDLLLLLLLLLHKL